MILMPAHEISIHAFSNDEVGCTMNKLTTSVLAASAAFLLSAAAAESSTNTLPRWQVPTNWVEITPGPAMIAAFSPAADSARPIVVWVGCLRPGIGLHRERPPA